MMTIDGVLLAEFFEELELGVGDGAGVADGDLGFGAGVLGGALGFGGEEVAIALRVFVAGANGVAHAADSAAGVAFELGTFKLGVFETQGFCACGLHGLGSGAAAAVCGDAGRSSLTQRGGGVEERGIGERVAVSSCRQ